MKKENLCDFGNEVLERTPEAQSMKIELIFKNKNFNFNLKFKSKTFALQRHRLVQ